MGKTLHDLSQKLNKFTSFLDGQWRDRFAWTQQYRFFSESKQVHWPDSFGILWGEDIPRGSGVYTFMDANDELLYVGSTGAIGYRLGNYLSYKKGTKECQISDKRVDGACSVMVCPCVPELYFLAPALEWFLITELDPPKNTNLRTARSDS